MPDPTKRTDVDPVAPRNATGGESQGGAYPNPHRGQKPSEGGLMGHGGQGDIGYHGTGQLGDEKTGDNANAPSEAPADDRRES